MLLDDVAALLATGGLGTVGTSIFKGDLPLAPDAAIAIWATGGGPAQWTIGDQALPAWENPAIMVWVRDKKYTDSQATAESVKNVLDGVVGQTVNGVLYISIDLQSGPAFLKRDENDRVYHSLNFRVRKARS